MDSHFKLKKITPLCDIDDNTIIPKSDLSFVTNTDKLIQLEYIAKEDDDQIGVKPGIHTIESQFGELKLLPSSFLEESCLDEYVNTKDISEKIEKFFGKVAIYAKYGIFPKRGMLLYGPPGAGKSFVIGKVCREYTKNNDTVVLVWDTAAIRASSILSLLRMLKYDEAVKRMILVVEDIGGVEVDVNPQKFVESSLLTLLDNSTKSFKIPTLIIATTNFPQHLLENLTNRPQRFDDLIEVKRPSSEFRAKFLDFFSKGSVPAEIKEIIVQRKYDVFSVAHIKEIIIRSEIYELPYELALEQVYKQTQKVAKEFKDDDAGRMGIN